MTDALMTTYSRLPIILDRGEGARVWDSDGREYLDALAGIAVCGLGHAHPGITEVIARQAGRLVHVSNNYRIAVQEELAERLTAVAGAQRAFFCNSGGEANETALKIARRHGHAQDVDEPAIVVCERAFHGRTLATLSASGTRKVQAGFEPLVQGFVRAPHGDLGAVERVARNRRDIVAVLVEPIQGEGGIRVPEAGYLQGLRKMCDQRGWLLMLDEIQTGMGRTGRWFAKDHEDVHADVMTVAKALGNGFPIGACVARGAAADVLVPGSHGTTFGGNPLACAVGLAVIDIIEREGLVARAEELGARMHAGFHRELGDVAGVRAVRGRGMMFGIELDRDCGELLHRALEAGFLINVTAGNVVRLLPPLIIDDAQADAIVSGISQLVRDFVAE